jgi:hypothetical protein
MRSYVCEIGPFCSAKSYLALLNNWVGQPVPNRRALDYLVHPVEVHRIPLSLLYCQGGVRALET